MSSTHHHKHTILYAEDDLDDLFVVQQAFEPFGDSVELIHASNGFEALEKLRTLDMMGRLPCLAILDINMPGLDGKELLVRIKQSATLSKVHTVLFTTSSSDGDKNFAKKWGADFITKPLVFVELQMLAKNFLSLCDSTAVLAKTSD